MSHQITAPRPTNGLAVGALITSLILPLVGMVMGIIALRQCHDKNEAGDGLAKAAIWIGAIVTVTWSLALTLFFVLVGASAGAA